MSKNSCRRCLQQTKVLRQQLYNYLSMGSNSLRTEGSYSEQYALFSGQYAHGNIKDIIESVYEKEM